jgi:hypothetical protein
MGISTEIPGYFLSGSGFLRADRRVNPRNQVFKFGVIQCGSDRRMLSVVKDISLTGARIEVENTLEIPDEFTLTIDGDPFTRACRVAWKKPKQIGVKFRSSRLNVSVDRTDRRQATRRSLNAVGWIRLDGGFASRECKILDVSNTSVRLSLPFAEKIPATFTLLFSKGSPGRRVRTTWRRTNEIGARFI